MHCLARQCHKGVGVEDKKNNGGIERKPSIHGHIEEIQQELMAISRDLKDLERKAALTSSHSNEAIDRTVYFTELLDVIRQLNSNLRLEELLEKIVDLSIEFIQADDGILLFYDDEGKLVVKIARDNEKNDLTKGDYFISQTILSKVIRSGKPFFVPDILQHEEISAADSVQQMQLKSAMCIPLGKHRLEGRFIKERTYNAPTAKELLGIIYLDCRDSANKTRFNVHNLDLVQALADQASLILFNTMLYEKTNVDSLTKLYRRPYFDDVMDYELRISKELKGVISVMMIDIDYFKSINDRFGHEVGDEVLQKFGSLFRRLLRSTDVVSRYGGEEFAVLLLNTDLRQATIVADKIRKTISAYPFPCGQVTVSIGISNFPAHVKDLEKDSTREFLMRCADQAMYQAKQNGRNQYVLWTDDFNKTGFNKTSARDILTGDPVRDHRNVETLMEALEAASSTLNLEDLLIRIVDMMIDITESDRGVVLLNRRDDQSLEVRVARNRAGKNLGGHELSFSKTLCQEALSKGAPQFFRRTDDLNISDSVEELKLHWIVAIPLQFRKSPLGVIYLDSQSSVRQFSNNELTFLHALSQQITQAIENARHHNESLRRERIQQMQEIQDELLKNCFPEVLERTLDYHLLSIRLSGDIKEIPVLESALVSPEGPLYFFMTHREFIGLSSLYDALKLKAGFTILASLGLDLEKLYSHVKASAMALEEMESSHSLASGLCVRLNPAENELKIAVEGEFYIYAYDHIKYSLSVIYHPKKSFVVQDKDKERVILLTEVVSSPRTFLFLPQTVMELLFGDTENLWKHNIQSIFEKSLKTDILWTDPVQVRRIMLSNSDKQEISDSDGFAILHCKKQ